MHDDVLSSFMGLKLGPRIPAFSYSALDIDVLDIAPLGAYDL